jgi:hypothetical protein
MPSDLAALGILFVDHPAVEKHRKHGASSRSQSSSITASPSGSSQPTSATPESEPFP